MKTKRTLLIVTDGSGKAEELAGQIAAAFKGHNVHRKTASDFRGSDLLPAEAFFLGCEKPAPDSFAYLADLMKHINLAGRPCGVFSPGSKKAVSYLAGLVKDSEVALSPQPLLSGPEAKTWARGVVSRKRGKNG